MHRYIYIAFGLLVATVLAFSEQAAAGVIEGTVSKIDANSKTMVVKTADGARHTFHLTDRVVVQGVSETASASAGTLRGLKEGNNVVVHYSNKGTEKTTEEIDRIGRDGMKVGEGTITAIDRDARTMTVKSADGAEETYRLSDRAARDAGTDLGKGEKRSEKVTVYYTEEAGQKVAHFFKKVF